ncbi:MAG: LysR family transcriptional regulator [Variovorax sp.]|nr:MAG: LysR family transcriptional regulator [Variovorax sp.]
MRFDLTDLRLFIHVVEAGSITGGATRAHMTLASASQRVRGMEDALGSALLQRHAQGVRPTEAGRTLLHHARIVLSQMQRLHGELTEYGDGLRGHVRLLCNTSAMMEHLPTPLADLLVAHPRLSVDVEERASADVAEGVRMGQGDIGICSDMAELHGLVQQPFRNDALMLVLPRSHALAGARQSSLADLAASSGRPPELAMVGLSAGNPLQELVSRQAQQQGLRLRYRVRVRSLDAVCRLVEQGIGVGIVPRTAAARCARGMKIARVPLTDAWAAQRRLVCVRGESELAPHAQRLWEQLTAVAAAPPARARRSLNASG